MVEWGDWVKEGRRGWKYNTIQYKHEYYYSGINPVEFRGH